MNAITRIERSTALDSLGTIDAAASAVTAGTAMFSSEHLAGQYAFEAALQNDDGSEAGIDAQLGFLSDAGALFDWSGALAVARQFVAQRAVYYATVKHHSIVGHWHALKADSLDAAKGEASEQYGDGFQDHLLCVGTARGDEPVRMLCNRLIGASEWQECNT